MKVHFKTVWGMVPASDVGRSGEDLNTRPIFLVVGVFVVQARDKPAAMC